MFFSIDVPIKVRIFIGVFLFLGVFLKDIMSYEITQKQDNIKVALDNFIEKEQQNSFYGLASFYNKIQYFIVDQNGIIVLDSNKSIKLTKNQWLAVVGHLNVLLIKDDTLSFHLDNQSLVFYNISLDEANKDMVKIVPKSQLGEISEELNKLKYNYLWPPLAWLASVVETSLIFIHTHFISNWGLVVIIFAILLKLLLLPISIWTSNLQRNVSQIQSILTPKLAKIKKNYDGEEAHDRLMSAHKELGVSPFYTLRPILGSLIQIPILIAIFNALGEMSQFTGQSFLWISDLAFPDTVIKLSFTMPMFGNSINLLPFIMTIITVYSTVVFKNTHAPKKEVKRQKRNLYFMAFIFLVLFYPFPAVMVLYWTLANILQLIQQKYLDS